MANNASIELQQSEWLKLLNFVQQAHSVTGALTDPGQVMFSTHKKYLTVHVQDHFMAITAMSMPEDLKNNNSVIKRVINYSRLKTLIRNHYKTENITMFLGKEESVSLKSDVGEWDLLTGIYFYLPDNKKVIKMIDNSRAK